jgi:hypothetical protein
MLDQKNGCLVFYSLDDSGMLRMKSWIVLYMAAVCSFSICVYLIYHITISSDTTWEWVIWIFFGFTISLVSGGYYLERDHKKRLVEK